MQNLANASRQIMWNISTPQIMYFLFAAAMLVFSFGMKKRISSWLKGRRNAEGFGDWGRRFIVLITEIIGQKSTRKKGLPGLFHSLIFYGFAVLVFTTAVVALDYDFGSNFFTGYLYLALSFAADIAGVLILTGVVIAAYRRYRQKPCYLASGIDDLWSLALIAAMIVTGYLIEGLRIAAVPDPYALFSPVGFGLAALIGTLPPDLYKTSHAVLWWVHTVLAMGWIASIPYTKFFHLLALPTNLLFKKLEPAGRLTHPDIEEMMAAENYDELHVGVGNVSDLTFKQRLDHDACIECGRCEEICPAAVARQPFSPKKAIAAMKELTANSDNRSPAEAGDPEKSAVVGNAFDDEFIWYCRTCTACTEVCPAGIAHPDRFIEMRRNEVLIQGRVPAEAQRALKMMENSGNPFGPQDERTDWIKSTGVRVVEPGEEVDVLYWIGCATSFDPTKQKIAANMFYILSHCGISFGVLGADETCCGDPARVLGQEHLFQEMARTQIEKINSRKFKVLLTSCPHCYNVLRNEYSQFGGNYEVAHHSEFLHEMIYEGLLEPEVGFSGRYVYHDPCYLGRYQKIYDAPREVIKAIPGAVPAEMKSRLSRSMCCGAGGGHYWMDIKKGDRINNLRVDEAIAARADTIVTSCPYCLQMIDDSVKLLNKDEEIRVVDLATLVLESLQSIDEYKTVADADDMERVRQALAGRKVTEAKKTRPSIAAALLSLLSRTGPA